MNTGLVLLSLDINICLNAYDESPGVMYELINNQHTCETKTSRQKLTNKNSIFRYDHSK